MEIYFLKSAACLAAFLVFYKLLLEKEDMHVFNRFYLLAAVLISFVVPFISFTAYVEVPAESFTAPITSTNLLSASPSPDPGTPIWPMVLWSLYGLGVLFFGIKFALNLKELYYKIKWNFKVRDSHFTNVLLKENIVPHTFLNYIFLNRKKFEENNIPQEVFEHEQAHAVQKHSYDILFMELLQVVFWFHPLLYLTKNAIKLNHEFLADKMVLKRGTATAEYQQMLLAFSSGASLGSLAHPINYSFIKKRFTVMKTQTSKRTIWVRSLLILPLAALLLYGFSTRQVIEREIPSKNVSEIVPENEKSQQQLASPERVAEYNRLAKVYKSGKELNVEELNNMQVYFSFMSQEQKAQAESFPEMTIVETPEDGTEEELIGKDLIDRYNRKAVKLNSEPSKHFEISTSDLGWIISTYNLMTREQKKNAEPFPDNISMSKNGSWNGTAQEIATPEMIAEYNKLAKMVQRYNQLSNNGKILPDEGPIIKIKDIERMKYIHSIMTGEQRKSAEPLPGIYPPPPPPPPELPVFQIYLEPQLPPSPPPAPMEHIKELAAEGAIFFLTGKGEISAREAIELVKEDKNISIRVADINSETYVHITKVKE